MFKITNFAHINVVVENIDKASDYYTSLLGAVPQQEFPHFKNEGFAKAAGFLKNPDSVDTTIRFLLVPDAALVLELMEYHQPLGGKHFYSKMTNQIGGVGHVAVGVDDIDQAFDYVKNMPETQLINTDPSYRPYEIDAIEDDEFYFFDPEANSNKTERQHLRQVVSNIRYFYFVDKYNIQWEFVSGMDF